jgi:hypothetical protein
MMNVSTWIRIRFSLATASAPPRPKPRPTFKPRLEWLEERWCPAEVTWQPAGVSGTYEPKVDAVNDGDSDQWVFKAGALNIQNGSSIYVNVVGGELLNGYAYTAIKGSSQALQNFTNGPGAPFAVNAAQLQNGNYELDVVE